MTALEHALATSRPGEVRARGGEEAPSAPLSVIAKSSASDPTPSTTTHHTPSPDLHRPHGSRSWHYQDHLAPVSPALHRPHVEGFTPADLASRHRTKDRALRWLRTYSTRAAAKGCMVDPIAGSVRIRVDATTGRGHVSGVKRCASPWACPVCSFKVRNRRADELTRLVEQAQAANGSALLMTVTLPHGRDEALSAVLDDLQASWRAMWSGRWAKAFKTSWGIVGTVRSVEVTWGRGSGWHPHIHAVLILNAGTTLFGRRDRLTDVQLVEMWGALMFRWAEVAKARGRDVNIARAVDLRPIDDPRNVAEYVTDTGSWSIGAEVASGPVKLGRSSGRWSPFALLAAAAEWGDLDAARLWTEYEQATAGKRAIVASRGLYATYGIVQASEEEAAEGPDVEEVMAEVELDPMWWYALGAVDAQRAYVLEVEQWAAAGANGPPPDPGDLLADVIRSR